jgi:hypothetical protein
MKRRSFLQVLLGALVVPSMDTVLAKTGVQARTPMDLSKVQEAQTGVTDLMRGMAEEFKRDVENEFIFNISPQESPIVPRVQHSGVYHEWHTD